MNDLDRIDIDKILSSKKVVRNALIYRNKTGAWKEATVLVECEDYPSLNFSLRVNFHLTKEPRKFAIMLFVNGERVFALDVEPGSTHRNPKTRKVIKGTHWQIYPGMDATEDARKFNFVGWMNEFCKRTSLEFMVGYSDPPFEEEDRQQLLGGGL